MKIHPAGKCLPGNPHHRCWACNFYGGGAEFNSRHGSIQKRIEMYEYVLEIAETMPTLSISGLWYKVGRWKDGTSLMGFCRNVVHDLWFHRLIEPVRVSVNGRVLEWRLTTDADEGNLLLTEQSGSLTPHH